jgi:hypothetical protein
VARSVNYHVSTHMKLPFCFCILEFRSARMMPENECYDIYTFITVHCYQFSETNMMHFLFSLLRVKGLYLF